MTQRIAYFINQYPKVSHSFIRREILALERLGFEVQRIALRGWSESVVDPEDIAEKSRTQYVLQGGALALFWALSRRSDAARRKLRRRRKSRSARDARPQAFPRCDRRAPWEKCRGPVSLRKRYT